MADKNNILVGNVREGPVRLLAVFYRNHRRFSQILVVALLILILAVLGLWQVKIHQKPPLEPQNKAYSELQEQVKKLRNTAGQNKTAEQQLLQFNQLYPNKTKDQQLYIDQELAAIYQSRHDTTNAIKWQAKALADNPKPSYASYLNLADVYNNADDNKNALKYYKLALEAINKAPDFLYKQPTRGYIQAQIDRIEGKT